MLLLFTSSYVSELGIPLMGVYRTCELRVLWNPVPDACCERTSLLAAWTELRVLPNPVPDACCERTSLLATWTELRVMCEP